MTKKQEPTGKERMRRTPPSDLSLRPKRFESDIEKAYTQEQLAKIAAIALIWNTIEWRIEFLMFVTFEHSFPSLSMWMEVLRSIKNLDRRMDLLSKFSEENTILNSAAQKCIKAAFDGVKDYRRYRNGIVHSYIFDHEKGIATHVDHGDKPWQILLTIEALTVLYDNLILLSNELMEIDLLYRMAGGEGKVIVNNPKTGKPESDQLRALKERAVPDQTKKVLQHQKKRKPLPTFPDAHLFLPKVPTIHVTPDPK